MATNRVPNETLENVQIRFRNFAGAVDQFNEEGKRQFSILLDEQTANRMQDSGWNVRYLKQREEDDAPQAYISVAVSYKIRPPRIVTLTSRGKTELHEDMVEILDWVDIESADAIITPSYWSNPRGDSGIKAYLKTLYVNVREDELEMKYADVEDADQALGPITEED